MHLPSASSPVRTTGAAGLAQFCEDSVTPSPVNVTSAEDKALTASQERSKSLDERGVDEREVLEPKGLMTQAVRWGIEWIRKGLMMQAARCFITRVSDEAMSESKPSHATVLRLKRVDVDKASCSSLNAWITPELLQLLSSPDAQAGRKQRVVKLRDDVDRETELKGDDVDREDRTRFQQTSSQPFKSSFLPGQLRVVAKETLKSS
ncbi:hypothetical protein F5887DRAFT_922265 [Amanita rubescens]|nr:hypothetical protein F5887DRAFT_922265 [Amanita rubescens]